MDSGDGLVLVDHVAMTSDLPADEGHEPFPKSGLDALLFTAAANAPDAVLVGDDDLQLTAGEVASRTRAIAADLDAAGLMPGERIVIVAGAQALAVVALAAALRAGLEPALVPCGLSPVELAAHARIAGAAALLGPSHYGDLDFGETYLSVAAVVDSIRLVATLGPGSVDGAHDLSRVRQAEPAAADGQRAASPGTASIGTFQGPIGSPSLVLHRQGALFADALSLVEHARINPSKRIVSTLAPATLAGLVAGPFAALVGASSLMLHGPFQSRRFLAACDAQSGAHLVAPVAMASAFEDATLSAGLASLTLVSRFADTTAFVLPEPLACDRPMVDLYAFGEATLLVRRRTDGEAHPPARVTDKSVDGGLGARLNRARAEHRSHGG